MAREPSFPPAFYLGLAATALLFFGLQALFPTLPLYVLHVGGAPADNGLAIWVFALASVVLRPLSGLLADRWGCRPLVLSGALLFGGAPLLYLLSWNIPTLLAVRAVHGAGLALYTTAYRALATMLSPPARRGEGLGLVGLASALTTGIAPLAGEWLVENGGFSLLFAALGGLGLAAWGVTFGLPGGKGDPSAGTLAELRGALRQKEVRLGACAMGLLGLPYGGLVGFLPLLAEARGLGRVGWAYAAYALALVLSGPLAGWFSDRVGRRTVILPGATVVALAAAGLAAMGSRWEMVCLTALYGLGWGALRTGLDALIQDSVGPAMRASAVAAQYTCFDLGVGAGSWGLGALAGAVGYGGAFGTAAMGAVLSLLLLRGLGRGPESPQRLKVEGEE
ncbi:MAG: MFS transporter [Anaerolineae bacterium]|jgi:MFS family permease